MVAGLFEFLRMPALSGMARATLATAMLGCGGSDAPPPSPPPATIGGPITNASGGTGTAATAVAGSGGTKAPAVGTGQGAAQPSPVTREGGSGGTGMAPAAGAGGSEGAVGGAPPAAATCAPRAVAGDAQLHFHHVHFNSVDPSADMEFFMKFYNAKAIDFCMLDSGEPTQAIKTERAYFLFNKVDAPADPALNSHVDHVGFANPSPTNELRRLMALDVPLWPPGDQLQCMDVADGMACFSGAYFYTQAPNGARIEVSNAPGPSTMGFAHTHFSGPLPDFYMKVLGPALQPASGSNNAASVDGVNMTNTLLENRAPDSPVDTKGKPMDHLAYSTADLMATKTRIEGEGIKLEEDISFKPEFGFKSFMVKSPQGVWIEIVEDTPFAP
jgi:hypothetical protein